jgi:hypothetical protein
MTSFSSVLPSLPTLFAIVLAALAAYVGKKLSDTDTLARNIGAGARWRQWLVASVKQGSIPEDLGGFLLALLQNLDVCRKSHSVVLPVTFFYLAADTLAYLAASSDRTSISEDSFSKWIETFLNPDAGEYRYPAKRLYAARCRLLEISETGRDQKPQGDNYLITYTHEERHVIGDARTAEVHVVSVSVLMRDLEIAIKRFAEVLQRDQSTMDRAQSRWPPAWGLGSLVSLDHY